MIASSTLSHVRLVPASRQQFLAMVPAITKRARISFRKLRPEAREELVQEVLANCLVAFDRLTKRGKVDSACASALARFGVAQARYGRCVGSRLNVNDVMSVYAQQRKGFAVERLDQQNVRGNSWREVVVEDRHAKPAEIAAIRLDFQAWLGRLTAQQQRIAMLLATGEPGIAVAQRFQLTPGRISQVRRELQLSWDSFQRQATDLTA